MISTQRSSRILANAIVTANCMFLQQAPARQAAANPVAGDLEKNFVDPPNSAKPWAYWVWFAGGVRVSGRKVHSRAGTMLRGRSTAGLLGPVTITE